MLIVRVEKENLIMEFVLRINFNSEDVLRRKL